MSKESYIKGLIDSYRIIKNNIAQAERHVNQVSSIHKKDGTVASGTIDEKYLSDKIKSLSCGAFLQEDQVDVFSEEAIHNYFCSKIQNMKNALKIMDNMIDDCIDLDNWTFRQKYNERKEF